MRLFKAAVGAFPEPKCFLLWSGRRCKYKAGTALKFSEVPKWVNTLRFIFQRWLRASSQKNMELSALIALKTWPQFMCLWVRATGGKPGPVSAVELEHLLGQPPSPCCISESSVSFLLCPLEDLHGPTWLVLCVCTSPISAGAQLWMRLGGRTIRNILKIILISRDALYEFHSIAICCPKQTSPAWGRYKKIFLTHEMEQGAQIPLVSWLPWFVQEETIGQHVFDWVVS